MKNNRRHNTISSFFPRSAAMQRSQQERIRELEEKDTRLTNQEDAVMGVGAAALISGVLAAAGGFLKLCLNGNMTASAGGLIGGGIGTGAIGLTVLCCVSDCFDEELERVQDLLHDEREHPEQAQPTMDAPQTGVGTAQILRSISGTQPLVNSQQITISEVDPEALFSIIIQSRAEAHPRESEKHDDSTWTAGRMLHARI